MNGIQKIQNAFAQQKIYAAYLTAGDGGIEQTYQAAKALIEGGVNLLEIGVPFSDPIADGPVIQRAAQRALQAGTTLKEVLHLAEKIHADYPKIPLILFSYFNPILSVLDKGFLKAAAKAGIDGVLIVDCPIEESQDFHQACINEAIAPIYILTPSTQLDRLKKIDHEGKGFLYYACRKGTTGVREGLPEDFEEKMQLIKANVSLPVLVGFGISEATTAKAALKYADGVVIGSRFVQAVADHLSFDELKELAVSINPLK